MISGPSDKENSRLDVQGDSFDLLTGSPPFNPRLAGLLNFWMQHRNSAGYVAKAEFNPFALKSWLGYLTLFERHGEDYLIRLDGTEIVRMTGEEWTRRWVSEADRHYGLTLIETLKVMVAENRPIYHAHHSIASKPHLSVGRLILPLSRDGTGITHAIVALIPNNDADGEALR